MRNMTMTLLAAGGLAMIGAAPAGAVGARYPFCLTGPDSPGLSNCSFTSYQQCQGTASGRMLYCMKNPYYMPDGASDASGPPGRDGRSRAPLRYPSY
jgi:hypothetical protein